MTPLPYFFTELTDMSTATFDPNGLFDAYRNTLAPVLRAQAEGLKAFDRLARYQYAVAGDYLEWSLSQAKALLNAKNPAELAAKQAELGGKISDQLRGRAQEFSTLANDAQTTITQLIDEATAKFAEVTKKAA
jgi:phasin family protein